MWVCVGGGTLGICARAEDGGSGVVGSPAAARCSVWSGPGWGDVPWCPPGTPVAYAVLGVAFSSAVGGCRAGRCGWYPAHSPDTGVGAGWVIAGVGVYERWFAPHNLAFPPPPQSGPARRQGAWLHSRSRQKTKSGRSPGRLGENYAMKAGQCAMPSAPTRAPLPTFYFLPLKLLGSLF